MSSATKFSVIVADDWRAMFARVRAEGAREGNAILAQIRAAMKRDKTLSGVIGAQGKDPCCAGSSMGGKSDEVTSIIDTPARPTPEPFLVGDANTVRKASERRLTACESQQALNPAPA